MDEGGPDLIVLRVSAVCRSGFGFLFRFLRLDQEIKRRALVQFDQVRAGFTDVQSCEGAGIATQPLEVIEGKSDVMCNSQLDGVCMEDTGDDILRFILPCNRVEGSDDASLAFVKGLTFRELRPGGRALDNLPMLLQSQCSKRTSLPFAYICLKQSGLQLDLKPAPRGDRRCRFDRAFQGTRVEGFDRYLFQRVCQCLGLTLPALVEMNIWRVASKFMLLGEIIFAVPDEQK